MAAMAAMAIAALPLSACSIGGEDSSSAGRNGSAAPGDTATPDGVAADGDLRGDSDAGRAVENATDAVVPSADVVQATVAASREQVFTATVRVEVEQLDDAVRDATAAVEGLGGFASEEDVDLGDRRDAVVTFRVPAPQFRAALTALGEVGDLQSQSVSGEDVTASYADLEGRVTTMRTSISRLQGFLGEAADADQVALLEGELTRREAELESVEAQRRALADQIELSTITVSFDGTVTDAPLEDDRTLPSFLGGLESGWDALVAGGAVVLAVFGFVLPFLPIALALVLVLRWWARRRGVPQAA